MKTQIKSNFSDEHGICILYTDEWFEKQKVAGSVVSGCLSLLSSLVKEKQKLTTLEYSKIAEEYILSNKCTPTFKNYQSFPEAVCISVNNELVHGIPKDTYLNEGDFVSFDLGATFEGAIADSALTTTFGESPKSQIIKDTQNALYEAIRSIKIGKRVGEIGFAINKSANNKYGVINHYGGHGIGLYNNPHSFPFIPNKSEKEEGIRFQNNMQFAIEPLFCYGPPNTKTFSDKWTVATDDLSAHFEHTVSIKDDKVFVLTKREDEII